jgi:hypothetical protein
MLGVGCALCWNLMIEPQVSVPVTNADKMQPRPSRSSFRRAVRGVSGSFLSRNNDVGGYWGIGLLYLHAHQRRSRSIKIDLLARQMVPPSEQFETMFDFYARLLIAQFNGHQNPERWITGAKIYLEFNAATDSDVNGSSPFTSIVQIVDDTGQRYVVQAKGRCRLHDPLKEAKSNRS